MERSVALRSVGHARSDSVGGGLLGQLIIRCGPFGNTARPGTSRHINIANEPCLRE